MKRKICIITGSRAEYGILKPLLHEIKNDKGLILQIAVTGMHLSKEFGLTYREIEKDGFKITKRIKIPLDCDSPEGISKAMGIALIGFAQVYKKIKPDIIVGLGDRFELMSAAIAAHVARIPIGHIGGGEITEGVIDDAFRHSVTKMSHLHFVGAQESRRRIIQLGEDPKHVFNVGEIDLDCIQKIRFLSKAELAQSLGVKFNQRNLVVTFHPVTLENNTSARYFLTLLKFLDGQKDTTLIFTKGNADTHGKVINHMIDAYVFHRSGRAYAFTSLGSQRYLSLLRCVNAIVGNSSSGMVEAPSLKIPTINIGDRQKGRVRATSVIDCEPTRQSLEKAFRKLYSASFQQSLKRIRMPYKNKDSSRRIKEILKNYPLGSLIKKRFYDLKKL